MIRPLLSLLIILLLHGAVRAQTTSEIFKKAIAFESEKKYSSAIDLLTQAIQKEPTNDSLYSFRSRLYLDVDRRQEALADLDKAILLNPKNNFYFLNRGSLHNAMGKFDEAVSDYNRALKLTTVDSIRVAILYNRGGAKHALGDLREGLLDCEAALQIDSNSIGALNNGAVLLDEMNEKKKAVAYLLRIVKIDSTNAGAYTNIGFICSSVGEYDFAIKMFDKCIQLSSREDEERALAYNNRGYAKMKTGDLKGALADINKSIELYPQNSYAYRNLGLLHLEMKKEKKACEDFVKAEQFGFSKLYGDEVQKLMASHCH